jgi:hypothetical protein
MLSPRRSAQLGLVSAAAVLAVSMTILIRGSSTAEEASGARASAQASVEQASPASTPQQLVLGAHTSSMNH